MLFRLIALFCIFLSVERSHAATFTVEDVLLDLDQPISIRFLPDGRMLLLQKKGMIRIVDVRSTPIQSQVYMNLADPAHGNGIRTAQERGLLDVAIDPNFPASPYIYLFYTPASGPNGARARIARFNHVEMSGGVTSRGNLGSEVIIWEDTDDDNTCCHYGGGLDFGPDGNLWLATGDHFQGSYATSITHSGGGVHRIRKDGSIPPGNPYADGNGPNSDSKFARGLRNPFRARWDIPSGRFFIGEVGGNSLSESWEDLHLIKLDSASGRFVDSDFGTANDNGKYDGINFGWPTVEGLPPYNNFPNAVIDPIVGQPIFAYKHFGAGAAITGGIIYRGGQFPSEFQGAYFYADSTANFIRYLKFNPNGSVAPNPNPAPISPKNLDSISYPFDLAPIGRIVCLAVGPEGALYFVSYSDQGPQVDEPSAVGSVRRYVFESGSNRPEILQFAANPPTGPAPLSVTFNIKAVDAESNPMTYVLSFGDGTSSGSPQPLAANTSISVPHNYSSNGVYQAHLEISDGQQIAMETLRIEVGTPPKIVSLISSNSRAGSTSNMFRFGDTITFSATATNSAGATLGPESFSWSISFVRPVTTHPVLGPVFGTASITFPIPSQGQGFSGPVFYRCVVHVTDANGLSGSASLDIFPEKSNISFDTIPSGIPVQIDGEAARSTPFVLDTLINYNHVITVPSLKCINETAFKFTNWSNGSNGIQQTYNVPATNSTLIAQYVTNGPCDGQTTDLITAGLVVHLESDAIVSLSGNTVTGWGDQSGLGNNLLASGNPQYRAVFTPSGQPSISLDGNGDKLQRLHANAPLVGLPTGNGNRTMIVLVKYNSLTAAAGAAYGSGTWNQAFGLIPSQSTGNLVLHGWGTGNDLISTASGVGAGWLIHSGVLNGGVASHYKNGVSIGQFTHTYNTVLNKLVIGEETAALGYANMDVAAVLIYNRALSASELASAEDYLNDKYLAPSAPVNNPPSVTITSPATGTTFTNNQIITFTGTATDPEQGNLSSSIAWSSNLDGPIGIGASVTDTLSIGTHTVTASVTDNGNLTAAANITITVSTAPPTGSLITNGLVVRLESVANVSVSGNAVTGWGDQSGLGNNLLASGIPQYGAVQTPAGLPSISLNGNGDKLQRTHASAPLAGLPTGNGNRTMIVLAKYNSLTAWAGTAYGNGTWNQAFGLIASQSTGNLVLHGWGSGNDLISTASGVGAGWLIHSAVLNGGVASHFKNGASIGQWTHTYNTVLNKLVIGEETGGLGYADMDVAAVLIYNRALTASERASVESYLQGKYLAPSGPANQPPQVTITSPATGATFTNNQSVTFTGTATDPEQGNLSSTIAWSSNLAGPIGTGASVTTTLSAGTHTVTASVTDNGNLTAATTITISVSAPPPTGSLITNGLVVRLESDANVSLSGNAVTGWGDQSGLGNNLLASGIPQYGAVQTPSGLPSISLNANGDKLQRLHASAPLVGLPTGNGNRTMIVLAKYNSLTAWAGTAYGNGTWNQAFGLIASQSTGNLVLHGWGTGNDLISTASGGGAGWLIHAGILNGGVASHFKNGVSIGQWTHTYNTVLNKLVIGEETAGLGYADMDVAAVLIYNRALTASERSSVESYLQGKYLSTGP